MRLWTTSLLILTFAVVAGADEQAGAKELFGGGLNRAIVGLPTAKKPDGPPPIRKRTAHKVPAPVFGLSCWIELVDGPGRSGTQVVHTRTFKSGEKIRLHFTGNSDGYISLVQVGASGTSSVLFPDPAKGLTDNTIRAATDRVLPAEKFWFRFDQTPGTEQLLVLFARTQAELDSFVKEQAMDFQATAAMLRNADAIAGSKDLVTEVVEDEATYAVNRLGNLVVMRLALVHQ